MPLITDYQQAQEVYREAAELGAALPAFCAEDRETLEAMLASVRDLGREIGVDDLPIIPAFTIHYPPRGQSFSSLRRCRLPLTGGQQPGPTGQAGFSRVALIPL